MLKEKYDVRSILISFYKIIQTQFKTNIIQTQFKTNIKSIRSNNGQGFAIVDFYNAHGIIHQKSCVYTPQQNSVVDRKHQHLLSIARALKLQSNVYSCYWGDCILTTNHIINRLPSLVLQNKTPFELLFHSKPSYSHFRVFGCLCYVSTISVYRDKFQPRAQACVLLGYPLATKGYKLLNLNSIKVLISRDVVFLEHIFPFISSDLVCPSISLDSSRSNPDLTTTLISPFHNSPIYHENFFNDQHFTLDIDLDSDDDADSSPESALP